MIRTKVLLPIISYLVLFVGFGCSESNTETKGNSQPQEIIDISLINLIATPEKYHNKNIRVIGYLNLEFEGNDIYLHQEDYERGILSNSFWVSFSDSITPEVLQQSNNRYVLIEGVFDMNNHGHLGLSPGEIVQISRIDIWNNSN